MNIKATAHQQRTAAALLHAILIAVAFLCPPNTLYADTLAAAEKLARAGKWSEASLLLRPIAFKEPTNFRAHLLLGKAQYHSGNLEQAAASLKRARALRPNDATAASLLGMVNYAQGNNDPAIMHLTDAIKLGEASPDTSYYLGLTHNRVGNKTKARDIFAHTALRHSEHVPTLVALARTETQLGHHAEAAYWFRKAVSLRPDDTTLFYETIAASMAANDFLGAELLLKSHLQKNERDSKAWRALGKCYQQLGLTIEERKTYLKLDELNALNEDERKSLIDGYLKQAMWQEAIAQYRKLQKPSSDAQLNAAMTEAYIRTGQLTDAVKAAQTAVKLAPTPAHRYLLAEILTAAGRHNEAFEIYAALVSEMPTPELLMSAAKAAIRCGKGEHGINLLKRLVATDPDNIELRVLIAKTSEDLGDIREALGQWKIATELDEDNYRIRIALARLAMIAGHHAWAVTELQQLDISAILPEDLLTVARLAMALGDIATGTKAAHAILNAKGLPPATLASAADLLTQAGASLPEGKLAQIFTADPTNPVACRLYTASLLNNAKGEEALSVCRKAIAAAPEVAEIYAVLLDVCDTLDNPQAATDIITATIGFEGENAVTVDFLRLAYESAYGVDRAADEMLTLARVTPSAPRLASAARACEKAGRWSAAAMLHESMIPTRGVFAIHDAAIAHITAGNSAQAKTMLLAALDASGNWKGLTTLLTDVPAEPQVLREIADLVNYEPGQQAAGMAIAKLLLKLDAVQEGIVFFETIKTPEEKLPAAVGHAYLLAHAGRELAACAELERLCSSADTASPEAYLALAECYLLAGNFTAAKTTALNSGGSSPDIHAKRLVIAGQAAMQEADNEEALQYFAAALTAQPQNADASEAILTLCKIQAIAASKIQYYLSQIYRYTDTPEMIIALAEKIAILPSYTNIASWIAVRTEKHEQPTQLSDAALNQNEEPAASPTSP